MLIAVIDVRAGCGVNSSFKMPSHIRHRRRRALPKDHLGQIFFNTIHMLYYYNIRILYVLTNQNQKQPTFFCYDVTTRRCV